MSLNIDYLIVGGGGAGGLGYEISASSIPTITSARAPGGGGGAGGLNSGSFTAVVGSTFDIVVGSGGLSNTFTGSNFDIFTGSAQGGTSSISSSIINTSVLGGGYGGFYNINLYTSPYGVLPNSGSSGGGDFSGNVLIIASGTVGQGNNGAGSPSTLYSYRGGGGGGASSAAIGVTSITTPYPLIISGVAGPAGGYSPGGSGSQWIDGQWYAGGGGGGTYDITQVSSPSIDDYYIVSGGIGGGGNSETGNSDGLPNTGGGGGGGITINLSSSIVEAPVAGGDGGSGIVKFRYPTGSLTFNKGETIESGGYYFTTFTETTTDVELIDITPCPTTLFNFSGSNITYSHSLDTKYVVANLYESDGSKINPNSFTAYQNYVNFDFNVPTEGWVVVQPADYSQSFTSVTTVDISHSLDTEDIIVNVFDTNDELISGGTRTISGSNNVIIDFGIGFSGYATITDGIVSKQFTATTESIVNHRLQTKNLLVSVYDTDGEEIQPNNIQLVDDNTINVDFTYSASGKVVIDRVCRADNQILIATSSISQSETTCVPITVGNDFENILTWQGTINFDSDILTYYSASNNNVGLTLFQVSPGNLTFSWISPYVTGSTFSSGSTLLELCFSGSNTGSSDLQFTGSPTLLEMTDDSGSIIDVYYFTGSVEVVSGPPAPPELSASVFIGSTEVTSSDSACIPVTVGDGFENILTWQGTIQYNNILLDFVSESNDNIGITLFEPISGSLTFSWISPYLTGSTFSSGSTLFELCFNTTGSGIADVGFENTPTLLEMTDDSGSIITVDYSDGSINVLATSSTDIQTTIYLYESSSEAQYFDILYSSSPTGPWTIASSGSNVPLFSYYSYTLDIPTGSQYLKVVDKNPAVFPDSFRIHPLTFGEPAGGTIPSPPSTIPTQSLGGTVTLTNSTGNSNSIKYVYLETSSSVTASTDQIPPIINMNDGTSYLFTIPAVSTSGSEAGILEELFLVVGLAGNQTGTITGSWSDTGTSGGVYPAAYLSSSVYDGGDDTTFIYYGFSTNTSITSESSMRIQGTGSF